MSGKYGRTFPMYAQAQDLKETMRLADSWPELRPDMKETLEQIQNKVAVAIHGSGRSAQWLELAELCIKVAEAIED